MVTTATIRAVGAVLDLDAGATAAIKQAVTRVLTEELPKSCKEEEAARLLEMAQTGLYKWRHGTWPKAPHEFIFHTWFTATDEVRYDREELCAYRELRKIMSTKETPQPDITREALLRYVKFLTGRME